ncbi:uncharacterized protein MYCFIDRAFT_181034 [Pseudocercospora fijiensis CIRAD86]|uniref:Uncharacterized protein n=1 Tax=Pseudocercospora fijiensis (strain CIRAD86) TaxID=383855 RepID=N1Q660_PSEFD|nr:uncharacterized protein MYCFIDRAFT_181034 [Pseudocercospora fijiensis CIRAD86]EME87715.1 hypothetical protein MYCFIDRAFT_181034 [Pseudocercospora fijiensis CIRAD86]
MNHKIATTHYFSIALFRFHLRSGHFGVDVVENAEMCSARLFHPLEGCLKGVYYLEPRRVRGLILEALKEEARILAAKPSRLDGI